MNQVFKNIIVLFVFVFVGCKATAQKFVTHPVKKGETLESVAKKYKVTPANILTYNKEIRAGQELRPNTILVIPAEGTVSQTAPSTPENPRIPAAKDPKADQEEGEVSLETQADSRESGETGSLSGGSERQSERRRRS